jgi:hypothetical protein
MKAAVKRAAAYLRSGKIYLYPYSRTIKGFWIGCEPILVTSEADKSLGEQVLQALAKSTENVPHPESLAASDSWNSTKALVRAAGVRSYEAFAHSAKCVGIKLDDTDVVFTPTLNGGYRRRFLNLKTKMRCQPIEADVAMGLIAAFEACQRERILGAPTACRGPGRIRNPMFKAITYDRRRHRYS